MSDTPDTAAEQGFLSHLIELRDRLLRMVIAVGVVFVAIIIYPTAPKLYDWLSYPLSSQLPPDQGMIIIGAIAPVLVTYKLALLVAFLVALPYVLYQFWSFVAPGLYQHEKRLAVPLLLSSILLFYLGIAFVYYVLLPLVFQVLPLFAPNTAAYTPDIGSYLDFVIVMCMAFGIGFEMPVATVLLIATGITTREDLAQKRPYILVGAFVVGMLLTPPDVISQVLLAVPMWLLFEIGLLASRVFEKQIERSRAERDAADKAERDAADQEAKQADAPGSAAKADTAAKNSDKTSATGAAVMASASASATVASQEGQADNDPGSSNHNGSEASYAPEAAAGTDPDNQADEKTENYDYEQGLLDNYQDNERYRPLTDEEMEAELRRIEAEERDQPKSPGSAEGDKDK